MKNKLMTYKETIKLMPRESVDAMLMTAIKLLVLKGKYITLSQQEMFNFVYKHTFEIKAEVVFDERTD